MHEEEKPQPPAIRRAARPARIEPQTINDLERLANAFAASGMFKDVHDMGQALVRMMAGQEFGIGPFAAMTSIHIVEGKPTMSAVAIAGCIKRSGVYDYKIIEQTNQACEIEFSENGQALGRSRFTIEDGARAKLMGKDNWQKYPRAMCFSRAMTEGARTYTPDVFGGSIYTTEELTSNDPTVQTDEGGFIVNREQAREMPTPTPEPPPPPRKPLTLVALKALYEEALPLLPAPKAKNLAEWLEKSGCAPGLSLRLDAAGKKERPSEQEVMDAEDRLRAILADGASVVEFEIVDDSDLPPSLAQEAQQAAPTGISPGQRMKVMAMFRARGLTTDEERHRYSAAVLGKGKESTADWNGDADVDTIIKRLEALPLAP